jgi:hypothetical protein
MSTAGELPVSSLAAIHEDGEMELLTRRETKVKLNELLQVLGN